MAEGSIEALLHPGHRHFHQARDFRQSQLTIGVEQEDFLLLSRQAPDLGMQAPLQFVKAQTVERGIYCQGFQLESGFIVHHRIQAGRRLLLSGEIDHQVP